MKVSIEWLKDYVDIGSITVDEVAEKLTQAGLEVDLIHRRPKVDGLKIALLKTVEKHPNADKLSICTVYDGKEDLQIVCGASNVQKNKAVVLASIGTVMPDGMEIKATEMRGIASNGMLCSERELNLSDSHDGIILLDGDFEYGKDANPIIGLGDAILEIGITPNRGDCISIYGVARDIAAIFDKKIKKANFTIKVNEGDRSSNYSSIEVRDKEACPYFASRVIKGVKIGASPDWLQKRVISAGMRPRNNVVDITNYIMLEYGQPMHGYDLNLIDKGIVVRNATKDEELITLDHKTRKLDESILVIADHSKVLGVAGVMGGKYSGISDETTDLLLEVAYFNPAPISAGARKLNMSSDASFRFVRDVDSGMTNEYLDYACQMIVDICGGYVCDEIIYDGKQGDKSRVINASKSKVLSLIGVALSDKEVIDILLRLNMPTTIDGDTLIITVPSYRNDINHYADVAEELARIYGIDKIPVTLPKILSNSNPMPRKHVLTMQIKHVLSALGYNEAINFSFMSNKLLKMYNPDKQYVTLINPLSEEMDTLRAELYPGIVKTLEGNYNQGERSVRFFEFATVFEKNPNNSNDGLANEKTHLCIGIMGDYAPLSWKKRDKEIDTFFHLKGVCESIFGTLSLGVEYRAGSIRALHPGKSATMSIGGEDIGFIGEMHPDIYEELDLKASVYVAELNFDKLLELSDNDPVYEKFSRLPSIYKDISMFMPKDILVADIISTIKAASDLIKDVVLFDRYLSKDSENNEASMAFRIWFSAFDETLTDDEVNPILMKTAETLEKRFNAKVRDS